MPWVILVLSAVCESVWAAALDRSHGFTEPVPVIVFLVALAVSMAGIGWAARYLPIGTAYAVWVGVGATLTVSYAMITGLESVSAAKIVFLAGIVVAIIGLKVVGSDRQVPRR
ncbi:DMT family transporter [Gordonia sp. DT30]|uniref:DMT family transporter n=1 Tax=unclassified Gordonia (in: high G+C Gram-positive bacteria) TaxID=2657482 RepID=UPI003CEE457E